MEKQGSRKLQFHDKIIYRRRSKRGWAIVIMPDNIRIDNFHGFPHLHLEGKGGHEPTKYNSFETTISIIVEHIEKNKAIEKSLIFRGAENHDFRAALIRKN